MDRIGVFEFAAPLWRHHGAAAWHFVTVPPEIGEDVVDLTAGLRRGFGSVRVGVRIGATSWRTSIFPDGTPGAFLLPVKKEVRRAEQLDAGDVVTIRLELLDL